MQRTYLALVVISAGAAALSLSSSPLLAETGLDAVLHNQTTQPSAPPPPPTATPSAAAPLDIPVAVPAVAKPAIVALEVIPYRTPQ